MNKIIFITLIVVFTVTTSIAQYNQNRRKPYQWMVGVEWNVMEDNGYRFSNLFDTQNSWNIPVFPSAINFDWYLLKGMSVDGMASYNEYKTGKIINQDTIAVSGRAASFDVNFKYNLGFLMYQQVFNPFVFIGVGYTGREAVWPQNMLSVNGGLGFDIMIAGGFGIQWRTTIKVGILPEFYNVNYDYLQHHFGVIYKFTPLSSMQKRKRNFGRKKYNWLNKKRKYRGNRGL